MDLWDNGLYFALPTKNRKWSISRGNIRWRNNQSTDEFLVRKVQKDRCKYEAIDWVRLKRKWIGKQEHHEFPTISAFARRSIASYRHFEKPSKTLHLISSLSIRHKNEREMISLLDWHCLLYNLYAWRLINYSKHLNWNKHIFFSCILYRFVDKQVERTQDMKWSVQKYYGVHWLKFR